jgi:TonB family protein
MRDYSKGFFDKNIKTTMMISIVIHFGVFYFNETRRTSDIINRIDNVEFIDQTLAPSVRLSPPQRSILETIKYKVTKKEEIKEVNSKEIEKIIKALPPISGISEKGIALDEKQLDRRQAKGIDLDKFDKLEGPEGGASEIIRVASKDRQSGTEDIISKPAIKITDKGTYNPDAKIGVFSSPGGSGQVDLEKVPTKDLKKLTPEASPNKDAKIIEAPSKSATKITITGPLSQRKVISKPTTPYPEWAQKKGLTAIISVQIAVNPNGTVQKDILIIRTSGFGSWDKLVINSVRNWKFAALESSEVVQSGIITFQFVLE